MACVNDESRLSFSASNSGRYLLSPALLLRLMVLLFASILLTAYGTSTESQTAGAGEWCWKCVSKLFYLS